jgi:Zn-dependent protease
MISPRESHYLGHLGPVPLYVHWSAIGMVVMAFMWSQGNGSFNPSAFLMVLTVLLMGLILHELGHGLTARALGATGVTITLWAFGGLCQSHRDQTPPREFLIVAAGPAVSIALAAIGYFGFFLLADYQPDLVIDQSSSLTLLGEFLMTTFRINTSLAVFNLLPIFPLDGGQLVYNGALMLTRNHLLVRQICLTLSVFGALGVILLQFYLSGYQVTNSMLFSGFIMFWLVSDAYRYLR